MVRWLIVSPLFLFPAQSTSPGTSSDVNRLQGGWEITTLIENGENVPPGLIRDRFVKEGRLYFNGSTIHFQRPGTSQPRELAFVIDQNKSPRTLDLAGGDKVGSRGIYLLDGDSLVVCLCAPDATARPAGFNASIGSGNLMMTLKRVNPDSPALSPIAPPPPPTQPKNNDATLTKTLVGTWGSQDSDKIDYYTLNPDGTFTTLRTWKGTFKKAFNSEVRSSGTWKVEDGILIARLTASTERDHIGLIYSYRIRWVAPTEVVLVDQEGRLVREWKVPR